MVDLARIEYPVILRGNQSTAYRDPVIPSTRFPTTTTRPPASSPCADAGSVRHGTNATWKALAEKMQMRPENYICNCGGLSPQVLLCMTSGTGDTHQQIQSFIGNNYILLATLFLKAVAPQLLPTFGLKNEFLTNM